MGKRFIALFLAVFLAVSVLPVRGHAAAEQRVDVTFRVINGCWDDGNPEMVISYEYGHILTQDDLPDGMRPKENFGGGLWQKDPVGAEITQEMSFLYYFQPLADVTFDASGGIFSDGETEKYFQLVSGQTCGGMPEDPVLDGSFFMGWYTSPGGCGSVFTSETPVYEATILYAGWRELVTVSFNGNNGKWIIQEEDENGEPFFTDLYAQEVSIPAGLAWEGPEPPEREGYAFDGWSLEPDGELLEEDAVFEEDTQVYALWKRIFTMNYDANGGNGEDLPEAQSGTESVFLVSETEPSREGHDFLGWNTQADGSGTAVEAGAEFQVDPESGVSTLYAQWERQSCTVTFGDTEGHCLWGDTLSELPDPESPGENFRFDGWYTQDAGGERFTADTPVCGDLSLFPRWVPQAEVTFQIVNGTWAKTGTALLTVTVDNNAPLVDITPEYRPSEGYKASGSWDIPPETAKDGAVHTFTCDPLASYRVTLWLNGRVYDEIEAAEGHSVGELPSPACQGKTFLGWYTDETGGEKFNEDAVIFEDITLYARWNTIFTLLYDANADGEPVENVPGPQAQTGPGESYTFTLSDSVPTRTGYTFLGWSDQAGTPVEETYTVSSTATLYARWEKHDFVFKLSYDANGGVSPPPTQVLELFAPECTFLIPQEAPVREGYLFKGWAWDPKAPKPDFHRGSLCSVTGEAVLYAIWENVPSQVTIVFMDREVEYYRLQQDPGKPLVLPDAPFRQGYIFAGWNTSPEGTGAVIREESSICGDLTVYAKWDPLPRVTVRFQDQDLLLNQVDVEQGKALGDRFPAPPTREGCLFLGWNTSRDGSGQFVDSTVPVNEDLILHAQWQEVTEATVTFIDRAEISTLTVEIGGQPGRNMPKEPIREGFRFLGWNTREDGAGRPVYKSTIIRSDTTVYAQWEEIIYVTVTFLDRGTEADSVTVEQGKKISSDMPVNPTRSGYSFKGWFTEDNKKLYKTTAVQEDLTVYAQWSKKGSNPKTGDTIFLWLSLNAASAAVLAPVIKRKRR